MPTGWCSGGSPRSSPRGCAASTSRSYTPHMDCRRQRHRHQRREGAAHRQQARADIFYWHTGFPGGIKDPRARRDPRRQASPSGSREGGRAHGAARAARPRAAGQSAGLCRARASARGAAAEPLDVAAMNRKNARACMTMAETPDSRTRAPPGPFSWPRQASRPPRQPRAASHGADADAPMTFSPRSTSRAAPTPPASARTRSRASGSSRATARSRSTAATARSISRGRCCAC